MDRKLTVISSVLWIGGIAATIIGLNVDGNTGSWITICGNIAFFLGFAMQAVLWIRNKKRQEASQAAPPPAPEKPDEPETPAAPGSEETKNG